MQLQTGRVRRDLGAMRPRCTAHPESRSDRTHDARATRWSRACGPLVPASSLVCAGRVTGSLCYQEERRSPDTRRS